jgi:DNA-binding XRE family transcriptional regulator
MALKRTVRKIERTPQKEAEIQRERARFAAGRPGPDELVAGGEIDEPVPHGQFLALRRLMHELKAERERRGLSLADLAQTTGLTRAALSRLENGWNANPTLDTLTRYALGVGQELTLGSTPAPEPATKP